MAPTCCVTEYINEGSNKTLNGRGDEIVNERIEIVGIKKKNIVNESVVTLLDVLRNADCYGIWVSLFFKKQLFIVFVIVK